MDSKTKINFLMKNKGFFIVFFLFALILSKPANAQENKIGLTVTPFGESDIIRKSLEGGGSYSDIGFYSLGITFQIPLKSKLDMETGVEYSKYSYLFIPEYNPKSSKLPYKENANLIDIPFIFKLNFLKYLFISGGGMLDIYLNSYTQMGLGVTLGFGAKYDFKFGGTLFVNPNIKYHSLLPFSYDKNPERLLDTGIRIGFMYKFSK